MYSRWNNTGTDNRTFPVQLCKTNLSSWPVQRISVLARGIASVQTPSFSPRLISKYIRVAASGQSIRPCFNVAGNKTADQLIKETFDGPFNRRRGLDNGWFVAIADQRRPEFLRLRTPLQGVWWASWLQRRWWLVTSHPRRHVFYLHEAHTSVELRRAVKCLWIRWNSIHCRKPSHILTELFGIQQIHNDSITNRTCGLWDLTVTERGRLYDPRTSNPIIGDS